ncbi:MAG: response regulator [Chloroflexi bacterium]|nr:response regulator [Chloroflexota bacterium]
MSHYVLVVDDDPAIRDLVEAILLDEGHDVAIASNGIEALRLATLHRPALILLDMRMPVMDGWQFAQAYRSTPAPHAPVVCVTAAVDAPRWAAEIGADGTLGKPFSIDDLLRVVAEHAI